MTHGQPPPIDLDMVRQLQTQGVPLQQMANRLQIPRSTLRDQLKRALPDKTTDVDVRDSTKVHTSRATEVHLGGATTVHIDLPLADLADFHDMLAW